MQIFPHAMHKQLLRKEADYSRVVNSSAESTGSVHEDPMVQRAVEDLIKKKIMLQANKAQSLYSQLYNTGK